MHEPVLLNEVLSYLNLKHGDVVLDGTVGSAGHAEAILKTIGPEGRLIGLDQDEDALRRSEERLQKISQNYILRNFNFLYLKKTLTSLNIPGVCAVLLDVGVSRDQIETADRGFSFLRDGPLDMRMDRREPKSAQDIVMEASERELSEIFEKFGEERFARRIARAIVLKRQSASISSTKQLAEVISGVVPSKYRYGRIHPATRVFQALRIAVNHELEVLAQVLPDAFSVLKPFGRIAVISFHSLEDRIVKRFFIECKQNGNGKLITKKPVVPSEEEVERNPLSRSAKLRVLERNENVTI